MSFSMHYKQVIRDTFFQVDNCIGIDNQTHKHKDKRTINTQKIITAQTKWPLLRNNMQKHTHSLILNYTNRP